LPLLAMVVLPAVCSADESTHVRLALTAGLSGVGIGFAF